MPMVVTNTIFSRQFKERIDGDASLIDQEISSQPDKYFEQVSIEEYRNYLNSKYQIYDFPEIHWEKISIMVGERDVPGFDIDPQRVFTKRQVDFFVPFTGDSSLLFYVVPNRVSISVNMGKFNGDISILKREGSIVFSIVDIRDNQKIVDQFFTSNKNIFTSKLRRLKEEVIRYNQNLPLFIQGKLDSRIDKIKSMEEYVSKFSYPIKKNINPPLAFKISSLVKKRKIQPRPVLDENNIQTQERFITDEDYSHILSILQDCGKNWEDYPNTYEGRGENALRDQLIFVLAPNIEGAVAGEAYNKKGKTDISIKYNSTNLFICECKIWHGSKGLKDTIDQILKYLTWRDSKAAIIMFVPNEKISEVVRSGENAVKDHPNYISELKKINQGWINYKFHLKGDSGSYLTLAIQFYHLPGLRKNNK